MAHPNWLKRDVRKALDGLNEVARVNQMTHAKVAVKVNDKGELVLAMILPSNYARAWGEPD